MLTMGQELGGRYEILRPLGRGGMGGVYLANHVELHTEVAVKEMLLEGMDPATRGAAVRQFKTEARILRQLRHPNLPLVYDFFEEDGRHYLIMEFVQGRTMQEILDEQGPVSEGQALAWARELCSVLGYLHAQDPPVIFRDLKPANVMVDANGHVKLIDFGIAKIFRPETGTGTHTAARGAGTAGYSAPEQYGGATDERTDIYSLGATLYSLLTGATPPQSVEIASGMVRLEDIRTVNPSVSDRTLEAVALMMRLDRKERPTSVRMAQALLLETPDVVPAEESASAKAPSLTVLLLIPAVLVMLLWRVNSSEPPAPSPSPTVATAAASAAPSPPPTTAARPSPRPSPTRRFVPPPPPELPPMRPAETAARPTHTPAPQDLLPQQQYPRQGGASSGPASSGGGGIQPGVGAGGVRLGLSEQQLFATYGVGQQKPSTLGTSYTYWDHGFMAFVQNGAVVALLLKGGRVATRGGVTNGSSEEQVRAEFGHSYKVARNLPHCNAWQVYPTAGIAFGIKNGRVDGIMVASGSTLLSRL